MNSKGRRLRPRQRRLRRGQKKNASFYTPRIWRGPTGRGPAELWFVPSLPGWPGWRTRPGRSGYDPIDYQLEGAHVGGVLFRQFITFQFRSRNLITLVVLSLTALSYFTTAIVLMAALANQTNWDHPTQLVAEISNFAIGLIYFLLSIVMMINIASNVRLLMEPIFSITDLDATDESALEQCAALLVEGFKEHWPGAWPDLESARKEMQEALEEERIGRVAVDKDGQVLGWIGGIPDYDGHVWELHPLVVKGDQQQQGIGRALVKDFEKLVRERGGLTITLGSDDEVGMTSLGNVDLYDNLWEKIKTVQNIKGHPYEFYQKLGYVITGVVPDANGWGKPDILMSKRVG